MQDNETDPDSLESKWTIVSLATAAILGVGIAALFAQSCNGGFDLQLDIAQSNYQVSGKLP